MKGRMRIATALAGLAALAACVSGPAPPAPPQPAPAPDPAPPPAAPPPPPASWQDGTLTAGDWAYVESPVVRASFGEGAPVLIIECTPDSRIRFIRPGAAGAADALAVRTTFGARNLPASAGADGVAATLATADPMLDEIAFSRGRFLVHVEGQADLVLPSWPEPARVIEECRGR
jgi:glucose/arabinose dehydrogenase